MQDRLNDDAADFDPQGASARPGGEAAGGVDPRPADPGDPTAPGQDRRIMRDRGFGDHKGVDIS